MRISRDTLRRRIVGHRRVEAGRLKPHPLNPHQHPEAQRDVLRGLLGEVGLARSLLAYVAEADRPLGADAPLTLIDGHLRREELGDIAVEVEVLDVDDAEARTLLLALDPLVLLADQDAARVDELRELVEADSQAVAALWAALDADAARVVRTLDDVVRRPAPRPPAERFLLVIECRDEAEQRALLERFQADGLACQARFG